MSSQLPAHITEEDVRLISTIITPSIAAVALRDAAKALSNPSSGATYEMWAAGTGDWLRERADRFDASSRSSAGDSDG